MSDEESLSSIMSSDAPVAVAAEAPTVEATPVVESQSRDASGKFVKPVEAPAIAAVPIAPVVEAPKPSRPDVAAIIDERRKRQAAEQELERYRQQATPAQRPSVFDNEDAAIASRVQEQIAPLREGLFYQSMEIARSRHGEGFADAEAAFAEAAETDPNLVAQLRASHNPGAFVYSEGLRIRELAEVGGDFGAYKQKLTAEANAKVTELTTRNSALQAELDALKKTNADLQSLPRSLNKSSSASPKAGEDDDEDLSSIVRFNQKSG